MEQKKKAKKDKSGARTASVGVDRDVNDHDIIDANLAITTLELLDSGNWPGDFFPLQV